MVFKWPCTPTRPIVKGRKKAENTGNMNATMTKNRMKILSPALYLFGRSSGRKYISEISIATAVIS